MIRSSEVPTTLIHHFEVVFKLNLHAFSLLGAEKPDLLTPHWLEIFITVRCSDNSNRPPCTAYAIRSTDFGTEQIHKVSIVHGNEKAKKNYRSLQRRSVTGLDTLRIVPLAQIQINQTKSRVKVDEKEGSRES